ncbi:MAG: HlyC/CorC family transporter [Phycisphaerales bacterium]|nr:HlyC/CorC family transporter [Phycisphaerales bacterium]
MTVFVAAVALALGVSFVCSLMEAALLSLTPSQVADLSARHARIGSIWRGFKNNIERPIAVILILNTAAHTIGASVAGAQFDELFGDQWIWLFSLLFTFAMLQYTEILPKTLGVHFNQTVAVWIARPLVLAIRLFTPVIHVLHLLNRPFEGRRTNKRAPATLEEITSLAMMARLAEHIGPRQERIINRATKLSQTSVQQVMIPLEQVSMLSTAQSLHQALVTAHIDAHTRFPVCEGDDRSRVIGYVNFKEMIYYMSTNPSDPSLKGIIRPVHFVEPESSASDLLNTFIDQHEHMAIARDAQGRCLGLITLEDLIEELVGELEDEFDRLPRHIHALSGGTWMFGGGVPAREVTVKLGAPAVAAIGTLAAWLERELGQPPRPGQVLRHEGVEFVVRRVRRGRVFEASATTKLSD